MAEDWDLWAVVKSCCTPSSTIAAAATTSSTTSAPSSITTPQQDLQSLLSNNSFGRIYNGFQELEQIIKPFITPKSQISSYKAPPKQLPHVGIRPKYETLKGKNRRKRVVEVDAENLSGIDPWNWHKYGRKPIKASPYPRNYYKCSNEGNKCRAKKYIEKSREHPDRFIVSYTNEHNHMPPIRRNKLSCRTRKKPCTSSAQDCLPCPPPPPHPPLPSAASTPPSLVGESVGIGDLGGDIHDIFMGLEELEDGGHRPSSSEVTGFDEVSWNSNNELVYW